MNLKVGSKAAVSFLGTLALVFSSAAFSKDAETPAEGASDRVELEDGILVMRSGDGLFIHDFLSGKTIISALNRTYEPVPVGSIESHSKPTFGTSNSMFLKKGYFSFTESKGVGELAEALSERWNPATEAGCNALYRRAESDTMAAIDTCLGGSGMMVCEAAIERAAQSWHAFDNCMAVEEQ